MTSLPPDSHVHSQFSWDAQAGSMEATCERAVRIGLRALAFTEHADFTPWPVGPDDELPEQWRSLVSDGLLVPPPLDLAGYRESLDRCRLRFPELRILSGVELGEPHRHRPVTDALLGAGSFDRVLASVHFVTIGPVTDEVSRFLAGDDPAAAVRAYLAEAAALVSQFSAYDVLAHIDYPVRKWPVGARPFDPLDFQEEYRHVLRLLARAGKALEVNTRVPLHPQVLAWWREDGGQAITFASDAHSPDLLAAGFAEAVRVADTAGFGAGDDPLGLWYRTLPAGRVTFGSDGVELAGEFRSGEAGRGQPGVVLTGPFTGVKEQVVGTYASMLAAAGFATLAFDHRGFGESDGRPWHEDTQGSWPT